MAFANDIVTRLFLDGDWRDISTHVRADRGISYSRGRQSEDDSTPPATCSLTLDNGAGKGDGDYTERNPLGQWYGHLGRYTPAEVMLRIAKDTCSATVSNGWGTTEAHAKSAFPAYTWSTFGGAASDYAKASGKATHTISSANSSRLSYLATFSERDFGAVFTITPGFTNVTGGTLKVDFVARGQSTSVSYGMRFTVNTDETIETDFVDGTGTSITLGPTPLDGVTWASGVALKIRVAVEGQTLRMKLWPASTPEPFAWSDTFTDEGNDATTDALRAAAGFIGIRSTVSSGNTNVPVTFSYDDIEVYDPIASGEVSAWPQYRDRTGRDQTVQISIGGPRRRLTTSKTLARSALYQNFLVNSWGGFFPFPTTYFPLEDGAQADVTTIAPTYGRGRITYRPDFTSSEINKLTWAADTSLPGTKQAPALTGGSALIFFIEPVTDAANWGISFQVKHNYSDGWFVTLGSAEGAPILIDFSIDPNTTVMNVDLFSAGVLPMMTFDYGSKEEVEKWHSIHLDAWTSGSDVVYFLYIDGEQVDSYTYAGATNQGLHRVHLGTAANASGSTYYAHLAVWGNFDLNIDPARIYNASLGNSGEAPVYRAKRVAEEYGYEYDWIGVGGTTGFADSGLYADGKLVGAQRVVNVIDLLDDAERVDGGILYEQRGLSAFHFRTLRSMFSRTSWLTLSMGTSKHLSQLTPVPDDRSITNRFTASRSDGGEYVYSLDTGPMSTLPPNEGGIGVVDRGGSFNVHMELDLADIASYRVARGTVDQERYPRVVVELHRSAVHDTSGLVSKLRDLDIGDQITLADLESNGIYDDRDVLMLGISGQLDQLRHTLTLVTAPAELLRVWTLGSTTATASEFSRVDSDVTTIDEDLTTTETDVTIEVASGGAMWIDSTTYADQFPFDVVCGGEQMTVTAGTAPSGQNQTWTVTRSVNGVVKAHSAGAKISLYRPSYLGL